MHIPALALLLVASPSPAAERTIGIGSFDRLRVEGPFEVRVATGASPGGRIAGDRETIERVTVRADGSTLVVRPSADIWGERPRGSEGGEPLVVTLSTPALASIVSTAGARITVGALRGDRVDLSVAGSGAIAVSGVAAADVNATVIGAGIITLAGRTTRVRLLVSGAGGIDAAALDAGELQVRAEGTGDTKARARYTARIANAGVGRITVAGPAKCVVRPPTGAVACEGGR